MDFVSYACYNYNYLIWCSFTLLYFQLWCFECKPLWGSFWGLYLSPCRETFPLLSCLMQGWGVGKHPPQVITEVTADTKSIPRQQLLCRESRLLPGKVLSTSSLTSWKPSVQDEPSGEVMIWAALWHGAPGLSLQQGTTSCFPFTRVRQHDVCPLSNQRSASPHSDNSSSCLGTGTDIMVWLEAQRQEQTCTSVLCSPPSIQKLHLQVCLELFSSS